MKKFSMDKKSIFFKMMSFVIALIVIQAILLTGTLIAGGVLEQAQENAYETFSDKVNNRKNYIQREMKDRWTNMTPYIQQISKNLSESKDSEAFFSSSIGDMINMLRTTQTTGAFIILNNSSSSYPALYLRDYDPLLNDYSNKDLYLLLGPSDLAKEYKIPLDQSWKYEMRFNDSNKNFFEKPFLKAPLTFNARLLGYWNPPFFLFPNDMQIMTYTIPLFDEDQVLRGVIGVELSVNYLNQYLPATDLMPRDSMGYLLGYRDGEDDKIKPILTVGALQKRMIRTDEALELTEADLPRNIYQIKNHNSTEEIYASVERIGLYNFNTPFESEEWFLIGMMTENQLLSYVRRIQRILWISFIASLVMGIIGGYVISYGFTKPIAKLAKQVRESDKNKAIQLSSTGLKEIDELSSAMETANNALLESTIRMSQIIDLTNFPIGAFEIRNTSNQVFITDQLHLILNIDFDKVRELVKDKNAFLSYIYSLMIGPEQEDQDVYRLIGSENKYIRLKIVENESGTMGVIIDVTEEIMEKNRIKKERDYDPLTMIYNRKAVQLRIEKVIQSINPTDVTALIMFDLDNLKQINDAYGHRWGDFYINKAVSHLSEIGGKSSVLGRRSGDEFILFLYGFKDKDSIRKEIKEFYEELSKDLLSFPDGSLKSITISGGMLWVEDFTLDYDELLHRADELLYDAKNQNKGYFVESD